MLWYIVLLVRQFWSVVLVNRNSFFVSRTGQFCWLGIHSLSVRQFCWSVVLVNRVYWSVETRIGQSYWSGKLQYGLIFFSSMYIQFCFHFSELTVNFVAIFYELLPTDCIFYIFSDPAQDLCVFFEFLNHVDIT